MSIALSTNKVAAVAVGVAMVFSFAFVTPANAQTVEDLTAQINSLLATIAGLQAQLAGLSGGSTTTGSYNFTLNHSQGDQGGEVMDIQKFLNANGALVSATGAGSPGNETDFFGSRTKAAVVAWQNANSAAVLAPVGLSAGTGYWGPSSRAYANTLGGVVVPPPGPGPVVPTGPGVSVSAAVQPGNSLAPYLASRVPFTKFTVTNNSSVAQTIDSIGVERTGLASDANFTNVVLLGEDGNLIGLTKTLNSLHQATIGDTIVLQPGQSRTLTVAGNMAAAATVNAGEVASLSVIAINTSATVSGSLPITGASHTINATLALGTATPARGSIDPNSSATKEIGTQNYVFQAIKITAGSTEKIRVQSVRWHQSGSASAGDLANVVVSFDGVDYVPTVEGDFYTAVFGSGVVIDKGLSKEFSIKGDIVSGAASTVIFDIRKSTDLYITGELYGYGITPSGETTATAAAASSQFTTGTPYYDGATVTISAGTFNSVSKSNAAPAANIAKQKAEELLGAFTVDVKGEPVSVETVKIAIDTTEASGTDVDADDITNITLTDQNGAVLAGPVDGNATAYTPTGGSAAEGSASFSSITFPIGVTTVFVRGQLGSDFASTDTVIIRVNPTDWTTATGDVSGDTVTFPNALSSMNTMTVQAATLAATTLTQPAARSIVPGTTDFVFATASLDAANSGEDVRVTALIVEDTITTAGEGTEIDNVEIWANLSGGTTKDSVRGDRFETRVADAEQLTGSGTGDHTLSITLDTHLTIPKNTTIDIAIVADLSSSASASDEHTISLDQASGAVTATGLVSGNTVSLTPAGTGQTMTVAAGGTLTLTIDSSTPIAKLLLDDPVNQQTSAIFRLAANNVENLDVDSIKITSDGTDDAVASYHFWVDGVEIGSVVGGQDTAEVFFNDGTLVIPANGNKLVTVKVLMNDVDGTDVSNGDTVVTTIAASGDVDSTGLNSGTAVDSTATAVDGNTHVLYEGYPVVAFDNTGVSTVVTLGTNQLVAKINVTNPGTEDVTYQSGDTNIFSIQVSVVGDDTDTANETITIKDDAGTTLDTGTINSASGTTQIDFDMSSVGAAVGHTIAAGATETFFIYADTSDLEDTGDLIQIWLDDVAADNTFGIDGTGAFAEGDLVNRGDIFGPAIVKPGT